MLQTVITVKDFSSVCRICLRYQKDMIDIFSTGFHKQFIKITKIEVKCDDNLPKKICRNCLTQMEHLSEFLEKVKSSDAYLHLLLSCEQDVNEQEEGKKSFCRTKIKPKKIKSKRFLKNSKIIKEKELDIDKNKYYVIFVSDNDKDKKLDTEICIKDISLNENENSQLLHFCKTVINDHSKVKLQKQLELLKTREIEENKKTYEVKSELNEENSNNFKHYVNLLIFQCSECKNSYEEFKDLNNHYLVHHSHVTLNKQFFYECPVCKFKGIKKVEFLSHLAKHSEEGFNFFTINSSGKIISFNDSEKNKISSLPFHSENSCKVFKVNLNIFNCKICYKKIENIMEIGNHLKFHNFNNKIKNFCIKFTCPVCNLICVYGIDDFINHLSEHQQKNVYFIKVNSIGEPLELNNEDKIFVSFSEAVTLMSILNNSSKIYEIESVYSCGKFQFTTDSYTLIDEHYEEPHSLKLPQEKSLHKICPVCKTEISFEKIDDGKNTFYEHLKVHKKEGVYFIEVNRNGSLAKNDENYSDLFIQSPLIYNLIKSSLPSNFHHFWCPDIECLNLKTQNFTQNNFYVEEPNSTLNNLFSNVDANEYKEEKKSMICICEKCETKCFGIENYKKHYLSCKGQNLNKKVEICEVFDVNSSENSLINIYNSQNNPREEFEILSENYKKNFLNNSKLIKPAKVQPFKMESFIKCEICNRKFSRQASFDRHKSAHLNPRYLDCDVCKLPLPSKTSLQKHSELHKTNVSNFKCKTCKANFTSRDSLSAHQSSTGHNMSRQPLECNVCGEKFLIGKKFTEHIKTHPKYKMGECGLCGKRLSTFQSLMFHMQRHFKSNSILCPHCGKQFFEEKNYNRHLLTHEGIKPYSCDIQGCEKSFYTFFELNRHKKYHNNTRDFVCPHCAKSFHEANHLTVHVRIHTGERPYTCPHCKKGFITRTRCKHHIKLVHQGIGYDQIQSRISKKVAVFETMESN